MNLKEKFLSLRKEIIEKRFSKMNDMQRKAVFTINGPLLILAGAGSGKTTVVVNRIANLLLFGEGYESDKVYTEIDENTISSLEAVLNAGENEAVDMEVLSDMLSVSRPKPWQVLAITFTNKAAAELKERLSLMLGEDLAQDIWAATFHSACLRILRSEISYLGYDRNFTIYDEDDKSRVIKSIIKDMNLDDKMFPARAVASEISRAKDELCEPAEFISINKNEPRKLKIGEIYKKYQAELKKANAVDFDDIIVLTVKLFKAEPEILEKYHNRFKYIFVDEYQDTNHAQFMLISLLAKKHKNLCVVGDDDQSIYRFRGATIENILNFEEVYPEATVIRLEQNYRSTSVILNAANAVIKNNKGRKGKNLWTESKAGEDIVKYLAYDERNEATVIADMINTEVKNGARYGDNAILYRMNAVSNVIEQALVYAKIPYKIVGGAKFYDRKEIKDALAYLHLINNPNDNLRLERVINEPKRGVGDSSMLKVAEIAEYEGISRLTVAANAQSYSNLKRAEKGLVQFATLITSLRNSLATKPLDEVYDDMLKESGYLESLKLDKATEQTRTENLGELKNNIIRYMQSSQEPSLSGFLEEIALYTDLDTLESSDDRVVLMTIHSAKGLEFNNVYLAAFEEGIFPSIRSLDTTEDIEEERRLAYVAITRAKKKLFLFSTGSRMMFGRTAPSRESRFLREIPAELVATMGRKVSQSQANTSASSSTALNRGDSFSKPKALVKPFDIVAGDVVNHSSFGRGTVISVKAMGGDHLVEINFDTKGVKKVMAAFAKLTKCD